MASSVQMAALRTRDHCLRSPLVSAVLAFVSGRRGIGRGAKPPTRCSSSFLFKLPLDGQSCAPYCTARVKTVVYAPTELASIPSAATESAELSVLTNAVPACPARPG